MKTILNFTKLGMMLLIGILAGQAIFITFNYMKYLNGFSRQVKVVYKAQNCDVSHLEAKQVESIVALEMSDEEWLNHRAE